MSKNIWVVGGWMLLVACNGNGGGGEDGGTPLPTPEQQRQQERACILLRLPRPGDTATEWDVSGYLLVDAYVKCKKVPADATAEDFAAVVQGLATGVEGDASRVRITASPGSSP